MMTRKKVEINLYDYIRFTADLEERKKKKTLDVM